MTVVGKSNLIYTFSHRTLQELVKKKKRADKQKTYGCYKNESQAYRETDLFSLYSNFLKLKYLIKHFCFCVKFGCRVSMEMKK